MIKENTPELVMVPKDQFVSNELLLTTTADVPNENVPHYLNVASSLVAPVTTSNSPKIDNILNRYCGPIRSFARVYIPENDVKKMEGAVSGIAKSHITSTYGDQEIKTGIARSYKVTMENEINVKQLCGLLRESGNVESVGPNFIHEIQQIPNDPFYGYQWGLHQMNCEAAWDVETGHEDIVIAIVDSGVELNHPDLISKLIQGQDFVNLSGRLQWPNYPVGDYFTRDSNPSDEDGHGTHCAGIAAANSNDSGGIAGVCWGGKILPVRVMYRVKSYLDHNFQSSWGTLADIGAGIKFAVDQGAQVINLSLGGSTPSHQRVLNYAYDKNVCVVVATGNSATNRPMYPAAHPKVLAVGAVDQNLNKATFSNYGSSYNKFVVAPGVRIASTYINSSYMYLQGTSMASPFVSGVAGLVISQFLRANRNYTVDEVFSIIRESARPLGSGKGDVYFGEGLVDAKAALDLTKKHLGTRVNS